MSGTTRVSRYQKGKTNQDFTEARDSEWQWHPLDHMQVCTSTQSDNHASTPPLSFLQAGCPFCRPTNSVKALKVAVWLPCELLYTCYSLKLHASMNPKFNIFHLSCAGDYSTEVQMATWEQEGQESDKTAKQTVENYYYTSLMALARTTWVNR